MSNTDNNTLLLSAFEYALAKEYRDCQNKDMACLNYMTSRLRAALSAWVAYHDDGPSSLWWLDGLSKEMVM